MMARRTVAAGGALLALILIVLGVRGCLEARKDQAIKDYVASATELVRESNRESTALFSLLEGAGGQDGAVDVENALNGFRVQSAQRVDRARDIDVPDEVSSAQGHLLETLELRRGALARIANRLPIALGDEERREGTEGVAREMQVLLASDIIYSRRFVESLGAALAEEELDDEIRRIPRSQFIPDVEWLDPAFVADRVEALRTGEAGGEVAPGLHGHGLTGVALGGVALAPGGSATVQLTGDLAFDVQVANQGEHTETDVVVNVTVGEGSDAIELDETLDTIAAGETKSVTLSMPERPPTGQNVPIEVEIEPVPGEEKTDNNVAEYSVIFVR